MLHTHSVYTIVYGSNFTCLAEIVYHLSNGNKYRFHVVAIVVLFMVAKKKKIG